MTKWIVGAVLALALLGPQSAAAISGSAWGAVQTKELAASPEWREWTSTDEGETVYVFIYEHGNVVRQEWLSGCKARYHTADLRVLVRIPECQKPGGPKEPFPYLVSYRSTGGRVPFEVELTESSEGRID